MKISHSNKSCPLASFLSPKKRGNREIGWLQIKPFLFERNALIWIGSHCSRFNVLRTRWRCDRIGWKQAFRSWIKTFLNLSRWKSTQGSGNKLERYRICIFRANVVNYLSKSWKEVWKVYEGLSFRPRLPKIASWFELKIFLFLVSNF